MGYEIAVTPLQLVTAYSAIANGGELLEPHLIKEIRSPEGKVVYRAEPRALRRVMSGEVARTVQQMLLAVVQEGTATKADLATFDVAGKSGTARRTSGGSGYAPGNYTASFVGLFPGNDPQYVVLVKLDSPKGGHYAGGDIAAPVTKIVLRAALAARDAALDRHDLAVSEKPVPRKGSATDAEGAATGIAANDKRIPRPDADSYDPNGNVAAEHPAEATSTYMVDLPARGVTTPVAIAPRAVPDVRGLSVREAVRALHTAGFRVTIAGRAGSGTAPAAGSVLPPGTLIQLNRPLE
jgi:cell division protein FtsI (penicillin-binding protein 3)